MNTMIKKTGMISLGLLLLAGGHAAIAETPDTVNACTDCHGASGISDDPEVPTIAGASAYFLENQMFIFADEARPCAADVFAEDDAESHCALAAGLSEDEKIEAAGYYADQPFKPADQEVDAELASKGEAIHDDKCGRCHSDSGGEPMDDAGILAGQWKPYLMAQFKYYASGDRWQPDTMADAFEGMSKEDMKALAEFYAGAAK